MTTVSRPTVGASRHEILAALKLAVPASLAAMITPLLGLVDSAVLARGGGTADVAGVALAGAVFSLLYWSLGFLRMSVAGLVAQSDGRDDEEAARAHLLQGVMFGAVIGLLLLLCRDPIANIAVNVMGAGDSDASPEALAAMAEYIRTRLYAAPFVISFFAGVGFLTGRGAMGMMMVVVVAMTLINAVLDIHFVLNLDLGAYGIALGTALAEIAGFALLLAAVLWQLSRRGGVATAWAPERLLEGWRKVASLNLDIFIRTFLLAAVFLWFMREGAKFGDTIVAANQILMQVTLMAGLLLDGPAIAAETMVGKALGRPTGRKPAFGAAVRSTSVIAAAAAVALTLLLLVSRDLLLTTIVPRTVGPELLAACEKYYVWAAVSPLFLLGAFQLDGIYIGATRGAALRNSMFAATALFGILAAALTPLGNHGLWLAFGGFMLARATFLLMGWRGFDRLTDAGAAPPNC